MSMKIFAFSTDDKCLKVYASKEDAISCCEGIDVEKEQFLNL